MHDLGLAVVDDSEGVVWVGFDACDGVAWFVVPSSGGRDPVDVVAWVVALAVCWHWCVPFLETNPLSDREAVGDADVVDVFVPGLNEVVWVGGDVVAEVAAKS